MKKRGRWEGSTRARKGRRENKRGKKSFTTHKLKKKEIRAAVVENALRLFIAMGPRLCGHRHCRKYKCREILSRDMTVFLKSFLANHKNASLTRKLIFSVAHYYQKKYSPKARLKRQTKRKRHAKIRNKGIGNLVVLPAHPSPRSFVQSKLSSCLFLLSKAASTRAGVSIAASSHATEQ